MDFKFEHCHKLEWCITLNITPTVLERVDRLLTDLETWLAPKPPAVVGIGVTPGEPTPRTS